MTDLIWLPPGGLHDRGSLRGGGCSSFSARASRMTIHHSCREKVHGNSFNDYGHEILGEERAIGEF